MMTRRTPSAASTLALTVEDLTVAFGGRPVVRGVTFTVEPGERVALIGASGSGKSLTAASVVGTTPPSARLSGRVRVGGRDVLWSLAGRRSPGCRVAMVAQDPGAALNPLVPVGAQLAMPLRNLHGLRGAALADALTTRLATVGIEDPARVLRSTPGELSGGQRQRICIAIALAGRARLLVADEPTTALDLVTQAQVVDVLRGATGDTALLFITHDIAVASSLCDRALVLAAWRHVVPALLAPALAALGFLGLGPTPPDPQWGLLLAEDMSYVERAPWAVLAPTAALVIASVLAVALSSLNGRVPSARAAQPTPGVRHDAATALS